VKEDILRASKQQLEKQLEAISEKAKDYAQNPKAVRINEREFSPISLELPSRKQETKSPPKQRHPAETIVLESEQRIDDRQLRELLAAEKWKEIEIGAEALYWQMKEKGKSEDEIEVMYNYLKMTRRFWKPSMLDLFLWWLAF
jgi:hypothetical protein